MMSPGGGRPVPRAMGMIVNLTFESHEIQSSLHVCAYKCPNVVVNKWFNFFSVGKLHLCVTLGYREGGRHLLTSEEQIF